MAPETQEHTPDLERLVAERDLYRRLLELSQQRDIPSFLKEALSLLTSVTRATCGYLEIQAPEQSDSPRFWSTQGAADDEATEFQQRISQGVIAKALASGETVITASAVGDPRFKDHASVQRQQIEAVLCAPIGSAPAVGVLYLQGRRAPGPFTADDQARLELCATYLAPVAERMLLRWQQDTAGDATRNARQKLGASDIVGRSKSVADLLEQIGLVAPLDVSVLVQGETGTGKTLVARIIHQNSKRRNAPFVEINCAAIPDNLLESELFGAERGAHSAATRAVPGKLQSAEGGTLFLDEVGELSHAAQSKLLQLLHSKQYYPLGAATPKQANVRIIAATNADLKERIASKTFREDLYFRLHVLPVHVPPLKDRREDISELAHYFCKKTCDQNSFPRLELSRSAIGAAATAEWPGNIRQLAHAVEAATIRAAAQGVAQVEVGHLFPEAGATSDGAEVFTYQEATRRFQKQLVADTLQQVAWNIPEAAKLLDVGRSYLYALIKTHGIEK